MTVRGTAIKAALSQYDSILTSLEEMAAAGSSTSARANGLHERFEKGRIVLGLLMASEVIEELECLNKSLQKRTATIAGMRCSIECVRSTLQLKRNEERFYQMFDKAAKMVNSLGIEPIQIPHQRWPPKRYAGGASQHTPKSPEEHYRAEFYRVLDSVDVQFQERFNQPDLGVLQKLEEILLTEEVDGIMSWCDFVVSTQEDVFIQRIQRDEGLMETMKCKVNMFYFHVYMDKYLAVS